jgi:hypothetical protein
MRGSMVVARLDKRPVSMSTLLTERKQREAGAQAEKDELRVVDHWVHTVAVEKSKHHTP